MFIPITSPGNPPLPGWCGLIIGSPRIGPPGPCPGPMPPGGKSDMRPCILLWSSIILRRLSR